MERIGWPLRSRQHPKADGREAAPWARRRIVWFTAIEENAGYRTADARVSLPDGPGKLPVSGYVVVLLCKKI
jgi:hypothetical protein